MQFLSETEISRQSSCTLFFGVYSVSVHHQIKCVGTASCALFLFFSISALVRCMYQYMHHIYNYFVLIILCHTRVYEHGLMLLVIVIHMFGCHFQSNTSHQIDMFYYLLLILLWRLLICSRSVFFFLSLMCLCVYVCT